MIAETDKLQITLETAYHKKKLRKGGKDLQVRVVEPLKEIEKTMAASCHYQLISKYISSISTGKKVV